MIRRLVVIHQAHSTGTGGGVFNRSDACGVVDQGLPLLRANTVETNIARVTLSAGEHLNQQGVALMTRLGSGGFIGAGNLGQGQTRLVVQGIRQGQVAAAVEVVRGQGLGAGKGVLGSSGLAEQGLGNTQAGVADHAFELGGGAGQQRRGALGVAQAQLRGAQAEFALRAQRVERQGLLKSAFGALCIAAGQFQFTEPVPRFNAGAGRLRGAQVQSGRRAMVTAPVDIAGQFHQTAVTAVIVFGAGCGGVAGTGAGSKGKAGANKRQAQREGAEQMRYSLVKSGQTTSGQAHHLVAERVEHSNGVPPGTRVASLRKLVICSLTVSWRQTVARAVSLMLALTMLGASTSAGAQSQAAWASRPYAYVVIDQDVRGVLQAFGRNLGIAMVISPKVSGQAPANLRAATAGAFLDKLTTNNTLTWFSDGNMVYVDSEDDLQIRTFDVPGLNAEELQASLYELGVSGKHLYVRSSFQGNGVMVSGPPAYMALVQQRIDQMAPTEQQASPVVTREHGVRVFRGSAGIEVVKNKSASQ